MSRVTYNLSGVTLLVVDDNMSMRSLVVLILRRLGATNILQASNAREAMALVKAEKPDLMIIDYLLDEMDGITVIEAVRNSEESPNPFLPIMMMTGFAEPHVVFRARDAGVNEFVAKPVSVESLASRITLMIDKARPFVRSKEYFGPDRRRRVMEGPDTPRRRKDDAEMAEEEDGALEIVD